MVSGDSSSPSKSRRGWIFGLVAAIFSWTALALTFVMAGGFAMVTILGSDLPTYDELAEYSPPTISRIFSTEGQLIDEFARERRLFTPIEEIPRLVVEAMISAEDKHYFTHQGYDPLGIVKAGIQALRGERLRGASTITQQVMKNFLLGGERSVERKIKEIILAVKLDQALGKDRVLELYLNQIFMGQNSFGITAAAQTYFNKSLDELTIDEAAYLASLPKAPSTYHPTRQRDRALARRNFVIKEMEENGYITAAEGSQARERELKTVLSGHYDSFRTSLPPRGYFTDEIRRQLSKEFGEKELFEGGLNVRATIEPELQAKAQLALRNTLVRYDRTRGKWVGTGIVVESLDNVNQFLKNLSLPRDIEGWRLAVAYAFEGNKAYVHIEGLEPSSDHFIAQDDIQWVRRDVKGQLADRTRKFEDFLQVGEVVYVSPLVSKGGETRSWDLRQIPDIQGAFVAMDINTARVLSMVGGFSYQHSAFNRATQAYRQPGSAFKPIVYATALDSGYTPASVVFDAPIELETAQGIWRPSNYSNKFFGAVTLRTGIEMSRNLMTIRLAREVGLDKIAEYAQRIGVYDDMPPLLANSLGAKETTLLKLAVAYAMFANGGQRVTPTLVDRVQDREGRTIYLHSQQRCTNCTQKNLPPGQIPEILTDRPQIIDPITAYQITSMLEGVVKRGTAATVIDVNFPVAGKTGTTNEAKDAWFIGFTSDIVAGCYVGFDDPKSLGRRATGSQLCGVAFNDFIKEVGQKLGASDFDVPDGGVFVDISRTSGEPVSSRQPLDEDRTVTEFFRFGSEPEMGRLYTIDGGFQMSADLEIVEFAEWDETIYDRDGRTADSGENQSDALSDLNDPATKNERSSFFSISAGGLY